MYVYFFVENINIYSMKKIFLFLLFVNFISFQAVMADDGDIWDYFGDQNVYGQKPVSDKEFEDTVQRLEEKKNKTKKMKGESFHQANETDFLTNVPSELPILLIPVVLKLTDNVQLPMGHYQVEGAKKDGKVFLKLYQAHYLMAELPAQETNDDLGSESVNFVKLDQLNDEQIIIKFGSVDFNAYSVLNVAQ